MLSNKGAMFGLESRACKKQFGKLFLESFRRLTFRLVEGHQASRVQTAKGAMFGLDARIALAIFGALSVISGAALYSAIKKSKTEMYRQTLEEFAKASEAYYLDTFEQIPMTGDGVTTYAEAIVTNRDGLSTWNGPYISAEINTSTSLKSSVINGMVKSSGYLQYRLYKVSDFTSSSASPPVCVVDESDCAEYVIVVATTTAGVSNLKSIFDDLDASIDRSNGELTGSVRYYSTVGNVANLLYMSRYRKR
ncbi:MAG TPA: hypothetical protein DCL21_06915 [Alphaproteobacteria bacterium]|nr:hypothetical protein [Alphaproteobacteria bacterium]